MIKTSSGLFRRYLSSSIAGLLLVSGCAGGKMLKAGQKAHELSGDGGISVQGVNGSALSLARLYAKGPILLVFLRGFS